MPERILAYGAYSSGKTHAWATIAAYYRKTGNEGHFYVINTEPGAIDRLSDAYEDFGNVTWIDVRSWEELRDATTTFLGNAQKDDWIIIEGIDMPWIWVRRFYDEYRASKLGITVDQRDPFGVLEEANDIGKWDKINPAYMAWIMPLIDPGTNPAHLFATAPPKPVVKGGGKPGEWVTDGDNVAAFGWLGLYPQGQKFLARHFFSVLFMQRGADGKSWTITSADDHTRDQLRDAPVMDFVLTYLRPIGRWEL